MDTLDACCAIELILLSPDAKNATHKKKMRHLLPYSYLLAIAEAGSIRKAADILAITPSALNRRLLSIEEELGTNLFERMADGVRPSTAGEIFLQHVREQISDMDRVKSRIADLSGMRLGRVSLVVSHETVGDFLNQEIARYRQDFPSVTFDIKLCARDEASDHLVSHSSDIALLFEPQKIADIQISYSLKQPIGIRLKTDHPLSSSRSVRLYELAEHPLILPRRDSGLHHKVSSAAIRQGINLDLAIETDSPQLYLNHLLVSNHLLLDLSINQLTDEPEASHLSLPLDERDVEPGFLFVGHLKGRTLPVASARFLEQLVASLAKLADRSE